MAPASPTSPPATARREVPFVGREVELAVLDDWWQQARSGRRQVVFVAAPVGVGKTALIDVFVDRLREGEHVLVGRGLCVAQFGESEAYLPVLDALSGLCRGSHGHHVREILRCRGADVAAAVAPAARTRRPRGVAAADGRGDGGADAAGAGRRPGGAHRRLATRARVRGPAPQRSLHHRVAGLPGRTARTGPPADRGHVPVPRGAVRVAPSPPGGAGTPGPGAVRFPVLGAAGPTGGRRLPPRAARTRSTIRGADRRRPPAHRRQRPVHDDRGQLRDRSRTTDRCRRRDAQSRNRSTASGSPTASVSSSNSSSTSSPPRIVSCSRSRPS